MQIIFIVYLYRQNTTYVSADWIPLAILILALASALAWWIAYVIFRSPMSAFFIVVILWVECFTINRLLERVLIPLGITNNGMIIMAGITVFVAAVVGFLTRKLKIKNMICMFVLSLTSIVLLINVISLIAEGSTGDNLDVSKSMKIDFVVDVEQCNERNTGAGEI